MDQQRGKMGIERRSDERRGIFGSDLLVQVFNCDRFYGARLRGEESDVIAESI